MKLPAIPKRPLHPFGKRPRPMLQIKPQTYYKTRNGRKVLVHGRSARWPHCWQVEDVDLATGLAYVVDKNGWYEDPNSGFSLQEEWKEPLTATVWWYRDDKYGGSIRVVTTLDHKGESCGRAGMTLLGRVNITINEGEGL